MSLKTTLRLIYISYSHSCSLHFFVATGFGYITCLGDTLASPASSNARITSPRGVGVSRQLNPCRCSGEAFFSTMTIVDATISQAKKRPSGSLQTSWASLGHGVTDHQEPWTIWNLLCRGWARLGTTKYCNENKKDNCTPAKTGSWPIAPLPGSKREP